MNPRTNSSSEPDDRGGETPWRPAEYLRFADQRQRPALELLDRIPGEFPGSVVDLGCGPGTITRALARRWPEAAITGVDHSEEMLAEAKAEGRESAPSSIRWIHADIADWQPETSPAVIYSNAALHWLGDHGALFPRLLGLLSAGGTLAVQMPMSWAQPTHRLARDTLESGGPGGSPLGPARLRQRLSRSPVAPAEFYFDALASASRDLDIWTTEYLHVLDGDEAVWRWVESTTLRPVLGALDEAEAATFRAAYRAALRRGYPQRNDGTTLLPFRRLFIVASAS